MIEERRKLEIGWDRGWKLRKYKNTYICISYTHGWITRELYLTFRNIRTMHWSSLDHTIRISCLDSVFVHDCVYGLFKTHVVASLEWNKACHISNLYSHSGYTDLCEARQNIRCLLRQDASEGSIPHYCWTFFAFLCLSGHIHYDKMILKIYYRDYNVLISEAALKVHGSTLWQVTVWRVFCLPHICVLQL